MNTVTLRELQNHGGEVLKRVQAGASVTVTRAGMPVAEPRPLQRRGLDRATLLERWRHLPPLDSTKKKWQLTWRRRALSCLSDVPAIISTSIMVWVMFKSPGQTWLTVCSPVGEQPSCRNGQRLALFWTGQLGFGSSVGRVHP